MVFTSLKMKSTSPCTFYIVICSFNYLGLAYFVWSPTNQTTCFGVSASFHCVLSDFVTITWLVNGRDIVALGIASPETIPQSPGVMSTLIVPGNSPFSGASIVCRYGQNNSVPAFLTILGSSTLPTFSSISHNSTSTSLTWNFAPDDYSTLSYQMEIKNKFGKLVYNETLSRSQLVYTIPDPCDHYDAAVTAIYEYQNQKCLSNASVQIVGASPSTPTILKIQFECPLSPQGLLNITIGVLPQQGVCSYNILWTSSGSQPISYQAQKTIVLNLNQPILIVSLPPNLLTNFTIIASNSYGNGSYSMILSTCDIINVVINATSSLGHWEADCSFSSCSQSIGCLVFLNETFCTASKRYRNSSSSLSCPLSSKNLLPGAGAYTLKAYAVLINGSFLDCVYTGSTLLTNNAIATSSTGIQPSSDATAYSFNGTQSHSSRNGHLNNLRSTRDDTQELNTISSVNSDPSNQAPDDSKTGNADQSNQIKSMVNCNGTNHHTNIQDECRTCNDNVDTNNSNALNRVDNNAAATNSNSTLKDLVLNHNISELETELSEMNISSKYEDGRSLLHFAAIQNSPEIVECLIKKGIDVNIQDNNKLTALHLAARSGSAGSLRKLLETPGIRIKEKDRVGNMAIHEAVLHCRLSCMKIFKEWPFDFTIPGEGGYSALHIAAKIGWYEGVEYILNNKLENNDQSALHIAVRNNRIQIMELLIKRNWNVNNNDKVHGGITPLHEAAKFGRTECVQFLIQNGANVNCCTKNGNTPLHRAVVSAQKEVIQQLLNCPDIDAKCTNKVGNTPLIFAAANGLFEITELLLGVSDVNAKNNFGDTALHYAQTGKYSAVVNLLQSYIGNNSNIVTDIAVKDDTLISKMRVSDSTDDLHDELPIHRAAMQSASDIEELLKQPGIDVNISDKHGFTALHLAAKHGNAGCLQQLLSVTGVKTQKMNNDDNMAIHEAALHCHLSCLEVFKKDSPIHFRAQGKDGNSALHLAAMNDWLPGVEYMLKNGNINANDLLNNEKQTALHLAARNNRVKIVNFLLKEKSDINIMDKARLTPLHEAAKYGCIDCVQSLVDKGADVNCLTENGNTPLHRAVATAQKEVIEILLPLSNIDSVNENGNTVLHIAAGWYEDVVNEEKKDETTPPLSTSKNILRCLEILLGAPGDIVNKKNKDNQTPLHIAARCGLISSLSCLVTNGKDIEVNEKDKNGSTALHLAARSGMSQCVEKLLSISGIDKMAEDKNGHMPIHVAVRENRITCLKVFMNDGFICTNMNKNGDNILRYAAQCGCSDGVKYILDTGVDVDSINSDGQTALMIASREGQTQCLKLLWERGANINHQDKNGDNVLHYAARSGCIDGVIYILENGVNVDSINNDEQTALMIASREGHTQCLNLLFERGANINHQDKKKQTALMIASLEGQKKSLQLLLGKGADFNHQDKEGNTALHLAAMRNRKKSVKCLLSEPLINTNCVNHNGKKPVMLTTDVEIKTLLQNKTQGTRAV